MTQGGRVVRCLNCGLPRHEGDPVCGTCGDDRSILPGSGAGSRSSGPARVVPRAPGSSTSKLPPSPAVGSRSPALRQRPVQVLIGVSVLALAIVGFVLATSRGGAGKRSGGPITIATPSTEPQPLRSISTDSVSSELPPTSLVEPRPTDVASGRPADPSRSVVRIEIHDGDRVCGTGSGTVYPSTSYIVTNEHVVHGAERCNSFRILRPSDDQSDVITVGEGRLLGFDRDSDLARNKCNED